MIFAEVLSLVAKKVDEDTTATHRYIADSTFTRAINRAQAIFAFLTLCYEKSSVLTFTPNEPSLEFIADIPDFIAPLKLSQGGRMLNQQSLQQIAARNNQWTGFPDMPKYYCLVASNLLAIAPPPSSVTVAQVAIVYAAMPLDGALDLIPSEDHDAIAQGSAAIIRQLILGGQFGPGAEEDLDGYWMAIKRRTDYVMNRNKTARYDTMPAGVTKEGLKALLEKIK